MSQFFINGGRPLHGEVVLDCAKNSLLPILAACILVEGRVELKRVPKYSDVLAMCNILENLGAKICWQGSSLFVDGSTIDKAAICHELACPVRSSIFTLGPLLARLGKAKVAYPGGCDIGLRPIDLHLSSLRQLGCKIIEKNGYIYGEKGSATNQSIMLKFASVGATENIMMFATLLPGQTKIVNAAKEPEIVDLARFLNRCGASITGAGTDQITINGVKSLHGCQFLAIPDRIECGTLLIGAAMTGGQICIKNAIEKHNEALIEKLKNCGCKIFSDQKGLHLSSPKCLQSYGEIETAVYPGFPTDLQPQMVALACICKGCSLIFENVFESRFNYVGELLKLGGDVKFKQSVCIVRGREKLYGADVSATDLRGGAALVLAGLASEGYTTVSKIQFIERGYFNLAQKLTSLGADIKRL